MSPQLVLHLYELGHILRLLPHLAGYLTHEIPHRLRHI